MSIIFGATGLFEVKNNPLLVFSVVGPYAAFLGGLCIYLQWFDKIPLEPFQGDESALSRVLEIAQDVDKAAGLLPFKEWLDLLDGYQDIKGPSKEYVMRNLLYTCA